MIHTVVNLLVSRDLLRSRRRILILLIQCTFSGIRTLAVPFLFPMPIRLPFCRAKVFCSGMDSHRLPDDQPTHDQLLDLLMGVGIGDFIGLVGVQPDLLFPSGGH